MPKKTKTTGVKRTPSRPKKTASKNTITSKGERLTILTKKTKPRKKV